MQMCARINGYCMTYSIYNTIKEDQINIGITSATTDNVKHPMYHLSVLQAVYKTHKNEQFMLTQRIA